MMDRPLFRIGGYVAFGFVVFLIALMVTFPDGAIKQIAAVQIEHQLERNMRTNFHVEVSALDPWWLGFELEGLSITERSASAVKAELGDKGAKAADQESAPKAKKKKKEEAEPLKITVPSIGARFAPLSSIFNGGVSASYYLGLGGGGISGVYTRAGSAQYLSFALDEIDLNSSPMLEQFTGIPMFGTLSGDGNFEFLVNRPVVTDGKFALKGEKITIGPKKELKLEAIPFGHANVPQTNFGNLEFKLHVEKSDRGRPDIILDEFRSKGRDLQSQIWGNVKLGNRVGNADARLKARLRFNPKFVQKHKAIRGLLRHEKFQNGKADNWYGLVFWGRFSNLQWKGSPTAAGGPEKSKKGGGGGKKPNNNRKKKKKPTKKGG